MERNVLLSVASRCRSGDFGIALQFSVGTLERSMLRVPSALSDFRFANSSYVDDVFSPAAGNIKARCLLRVFLGAGPGVVTG